MFLDFNTLLGKTLTKIQVLGDEQIIFTTSDGEAYKMYHCQDCCESVTIEDICGDLDWLIGFPILLAEERTNNDFDNDIDKSETWTFYEIATLQGTVTIRWYGTSNGFYSERVDFERMNESA